MVLIWSSPALEKEDMMFTPQSSKMDSFLGPWKLKSSDWGVNFVSHQQRKGLYPVMLAIPSTFLVIMGL